MSEDQQTYKRALNAALVGLGAQVLLTVLMALLGLYAEAPGLHAAALYMLGGVPVWIVLAVLFHQQRQERFEALEAEQLAEADAESAAIFQEAGDQLRLARKRLDNLIRYWLPLVSLGVAAYLLAVGLSYLGSAATNEAYIQSISRMGTTLGEQSLAPTIYAGASTAIIAVVSLAIGFIAFLVSRYVAGMTRLSAWQPLRGGAGYLMGSGFVALLVLAAAILRYFDVAIPAFTLLVFVVPAIMTLLGIEIVLSFTFSFYRPRKPGEAPKPAFESRLLGWLTRPESLGKIVSDTINYQFGFEISASWFYRLLARSIVPLIVLGLTVLIGLSSVVIVGPHQNAIVTRFGELRQPVLGPGPHFKLPWPVERVEKYDVYQVKSIDIGTGSRDRLEPGVAVLWTNEHGGPERQFFVTAEPISAEEGEGTGQGAVAAGLVGVRVTIQYRIADLAAYVSEDAPIDPEAVFRREAEGVVSAYLATHETDDLLSEARATAGQELRERLQPHARRLGLEVLIAAVVSLHPPQEEDVARTFLARIEADIERQSAIEDARRDEVTTLTRVAGSRDMAERIARAVAEADAMQSQLNRLRNAADADPQQVEQLADALTQQQVQVEQLMDRAGGEAVSLIYQARADRWSRSLSELARMNRIRAQYEAYRAAPSYFRAREYLNALTEGLDGRRKIVMTAPQADEEALIRLNLEDQPTGLESAWDAGQ